MRILESPLPEDLPAIRRARAWTMPCSGAPLAKSPGFRDKPIIAHGRHFPIPCRNVRLPAIADAPRGQAKWLLSMPACERRLTFGALKSRRRWRSPGPWF
jgi:hypothetical protein